jgi:hypothetical protein
MFRPTPVPADASSGLRAWLASSLRQIADSLGEPEVVAIRFSILNAEPARREDGDVAYADGTHWNPGSGAGLYERRGAAWHKL